MYDSDLNLVNFFDCKGHQGIKSPGKHALVACRGGSNDHASLVEIDATADLLQGSCTTTCRKKSAGKGLPVGDCTVLRSACTFCTHIVPCSAF